MISGTEGRQSTRVRVGLREFLTGLGPSSRRLVPVPMKEVLPLGTPMMSGSNANSRVVEHTPGLLHLSAAVREQHIWQRSKLSLACVESAPGRSGRTFWRKVIGGCPWRPAGQRSKRKSTTKKSGLVTTWCAILQDVFAWGDTPAEGFEAGRATAGNRCQKRAGRCAADTITKDPRRGVSILQGFRQLAERGFVC